MAVLDASFLIDIQRGEPRARAAHATLVRTDERLVVPAQAAVEFLRGFDDVDVAFARLEQSYEVAEFGLAEVRTAARLARLAGVKGKAPSWSDIQIAAHAILEGSFIVTADPRHFATAGATVWEYRKTREPPSAKL